MDRPPGSLTRGPICPYSGHVTEPHHHTLVQAPIDPVDEDGVAAALVGTAVSVLATLLAWWNYGWLQAQGQGWWLWSAITATGVGVLFILYTLWRKRRRLTPTSDVEALLPTAEDARRPEESVEQ